ncbi:MAG: ATP-binding protein [Paraglaciecola sp.]|uniref:ATP-binding protein n=1 Tax=Paraglaciecola sp. TaxID=1920173 RepID=UPI0032674EDA
MDNVALASEAILRIGEVIEVQGRKVFILVDKEKNLSELLFYGDVLKNISVDSYVEIRKGFLSLIGKVEGEKIVEDKEEFNDVGYEKRDTSKRVLSISLAGYLNLNGRFVGGVVEMPLIGNEAFILTKSKIHAIHSLTDKNQGSVTFAKTDTDSFDVSFPIKGLFNSHLAVFGNTGSGKSNTVAAMYQQLVRYLEVRNKDVFQSNSRFVLFDFNGEYIADNCITNNKKVFNLSTQKPHGGNKIPISQNTLMDLPSLCVLADATEKTQKPFIKRTLDLRSRVKASDNSLNYLKNLLKRAISDTLKMTDKTKVFLIIDYLRQVLPETSHADGSLIDVISDLEWFNYSNEFRTKAPNHFYLQQTPQEINNTILYKRANQIEFKTDTISDFIDFAYLQLAFDLISNRAMNEHISPVINKLKSKQKDIDKIFDTTEEKHIWDHNFIIINLNEVNIEMKKTIPLLLSKFLYSDHKVHKNKKSLTFIIDEAHNILSRESSRESESWKDYRLETFEEVIKEGRKFGVFVTISSQRPSDISPTITSQAHNYFIHRLVNQKDLITISNAVSYIDKVTEESIPILPTGTCIFSGVASPMPLKLKVNALPESAQPQSTTLDFLEIIPESDVM